MEKPRFWADRHRVRRCDHTTGHSVATIAMCENSTAAKTIAAALNAFSSHDFEESDYQAAKEEQRK